jgi:WD40 repeat protein
MGYLKIAISCMINKFRTYNMTTGELLHEFGNHDITVNKLTFSPDDLKIASCSIDDCVKVWDATTGQLLETLDARTNSICNVVFAKSVSDEINAKIRALFL